MSYPFLDPGENGRRCIYTDQPLFCVFVLLVSLGRGQVVKKSRWWEEWVERNGTFEGFSRLLRTSETGPMNGQRRRHPCGEVGRTRAPQATSRTPLWWGGSDENHLGHL